ncbi:hypothetical protein CEUSTIGMA_g8111.t1 [Chlamydomonas eustigma]|uniref:Uncharacterized protein n=1 Tax=Chlamydomonas eustigma TaxID=1157962 RepID=A0A250XC92_9CHLO|nr:hypothetical protein CEUSTIGMA_g8111.t1 [Chlamydomonas eustigma]|eukprot:GAX80676.1 hypothetical protein CEUSTIGMA_g8111.t1 [Chlamydomonas eustigma]
MALTKPPPYYFWVSLALFAGVATLGTCGVVYYVGLVTAGNISGANSVALTSARELEKLLGDQKGPILSVAQQIELNPHWPSFNAKFEALAVTIAQVEDLDSISQNGSIYLIGP